MSVSSTPWMGTVTLTTANTVYQLSALLAALGASIRPAVGTPPRCQYVSIQANPGAQSSILYIGSRDTMSATDYGVYLIATQAWQVQSMDANLIRLDQIYLMSDGSSQTVNVTFITR